MNVEFKNIETGKKVLTYADTATLKQGVLTLLSNGLSVTDVGGIEYILSSKPSEIVERYVTVSRNKTCLIVFVEKAK